MDNEHKKVGYFWRCKECGTEMEKPDNLHGMRSLPTCIWCGGGILDRYIREARQDGSLVVKLDRKVDSKVEEALASEKAEQVAPEGILVDDELEKADEKVHWKNIGKQKLDEKLGKTAGHVRQTVELVYRRVYGILHGIHPQDVHVEVAIYDPKQRRVQLDVRVYDSNVVTRAVDLVWLIYADEAFEKALTPNTG